MKKALLVFILIFFTSVSGFAQFPERKYQKNGIFYYKMTGLNDGRRYEAISRHRVIEIQGNFHEEISWIQLKSDGENIDLKPLKDFTQLLSLDKNFHGTPPDISKIPPQLRKFILGPIFDLMTFYVDLNPRLFLTKMKELELGQPIHIPYNKPSSWADGEFLLIGEDCIDFKLTFQEQTLNKALMRVEHFPPSENLKINLPEKWMQDVFPNGKTNWIQISKIPGKGEKLFVSYGYEYFDVHIYIDTKDGKILSANMYNPVEIMNRVCSKFQKLENNQLKLLECSEAEYKHTYRSISLKLLKKL